MNNTSNRHISISPNSKRNTNTLNGNSSSHPTRPSKAFKKNSNNLNPQLSKKKEESNNKTLPTPPQQNSQQNKKSLKRTQPSKSALNQSSSTNTIQITKSTPKINTSTNNQPTIQTNTLLQPIAIINHSTPISPIPTTNSKQSKQFPIIPMLDFSNLPNFESEPEFQRCPPVPRSITYREPQPGPPLETPIIVPLHIFNTPRLPCDVKDLWSDYTVSSTDKSSQLCCTICLCDFNEGEKAAKLKCGHVFHINCIHSWINKGPSKPICPMCRQSLHKFVLDN